MNHADDYDKIMLSLKEKWILYRIIKKKEVPYTFCNNSQKELFLSYDLVIIQQESKLTPTGRVIAVPDAPRFIKATDKAFRYFLYQREDYFKGKLPVVIALIALVVSIIGLALQYPF